MSVAHFSRPAVAGWDERVNYPTLPMRQRREEWAPGSDGARVASGAKHGEKRREILRCAQDDGRTKEEPARRRRYEERRPFSRPAVAQTLRTGTAGSQGESRPAVAGRDSREQDELRCGAQLTISIWGAGRSWRQ